MSYYPENTTLAPEEANFRYWGMCYVKYGKEKQVMENFKKIAAIFKEKKIPLGFETYQMEFGNDTPMFFYTEVGKSAAEFWASAEKSGEMMGEEVYEIWNETTKYFRKYEPTFGMYRPDLSYIPKEK